METNIIYILTYIILYSFAGWVLESISKSIEERQLVNSGFLNGPICPIYGLGAMIMSFTLTSLKDNAILLFIVAFFVLTTWEYIVGIFLEKVFKTKYWDYSHLKFNFQGRICLKNSIYWGILGVVFIRFVHPFVQSQVYLVDFQLLKYINILVYSIFTVDVVFSVMTVINIDSTIEKINMLGENIKQKVEELKNSSSRSTVENIEKVIRELKLKQTKIKLRMYRQTKRLKKAFESINKFLSQKIDLESLRRIVKRKGKDDIDKN